MKAGDEDLGSLSDVVSVMLLLALLVATPLLYDVAAALRLTQ